MRHFKSRELAISGLLIAVGIIIPLFSPVKIVLEPASFTLASHVPIFLALFISPYVALSVAVGTTMGFAFAGFPPVVVARAASQLVFATLGALYLKRHPLESMSPVRQRAFSLCIGAVHALGEVAVAGAFYLSGALSGQSFLMSILVLVGLGTALHSMFDFEIARFLDLRLHLTRRIKGAKGSPSLERQSAA